MRGHSSGLPSSPRITFCKFTRSNDRRTSTRRSRFAIRARLDGGKKSYNASAADFRLEVALGAVLKELKSEAARDKDNHYRKTDAEFEAEE